MSYCECYRVIDVFVRWGGSRYPARAVKVTRFEGFDNEGLNISSYDFEETIALDLGFEFGFDFAGQVE